MSEKKGCTPEQLALAYINCISGIWVPFGYGAILISLNFKDLKNNYEPTRGLILLHAQYKGLFGRFSGLIREIVERHKTRLLLVRPLLNFDRPWISMDDRRSTKRDFQLASNTWRLDDDGVCTRDHRRRVLNGLRRISSFGLDHGRAQESIDETGTLLVHKTEGSTTMVFRNSD
ncbi:unnamed protein product [Brassica oleracea var. botrytis]|uniref:Uncharacterized protein n=1 Tax=Brassica oleracea TaxID=3712 RepID=A0A3P6F108_BRAOL|nr:unnamed protein product [Brassica oleracea]